MTQSSGSPAGQGAGAGAGVKAGHTPPRLQKTSTGTPAARSEHVNVHEAAKSIRQSFKRPATWVLVFGWSLAMCAGIANSVAFRSWGVYIGNMSGTTTNIGMRIEGYHIRNETPTQLRQTAYCVVWFFFGAYFCGLLIDKNQVHFGGKALYGAALLGNSALLVIASIVSPAPTAMYFGATACGLQNAMCTNHFGAIVRTTHVTGTLTDIGSTCGRLTMLFLRARCRASRMTPVQWAEVAVDARKLLVLVPLWISFLVGSIVGAYLYGFFGDTAFLFPAGVTGTVGFIYMFFRNTLKENIRKLERERLARRLRKVETALHRTHDFVHELQQEEGGRSCTHTAELDEEVSHMLEVVQDVEACLGDLYGQREAVPQAGASPSAKFRRQHTF